MHAMLALKCYQVETRELRSSTEDSEPGSQAARDQARACAEILLSWLQHAQNLDLLLENALVSIEQNHVNISYYLASDVVDGRTNWSIFLQVQDNLSELSERVVSHVQYWTIQQDSFELLSADEQAQMIEQWRTDSLISVSLAHSWCISDDIGLYGLVFNNGHISKVEHTPAAEELLDDALDFLMAVLARAVAEDYDDSQYLATI